jgi:curved DNA-binding protein CbpA
MKLLKIVLFLLALVVLVSAQWDKDDYEIFELQAALEKDEGEGATFYSFFNLTKGATAQEIRKAYRARSMELHPDKHQGRANAARRFERLGVINKILRDHRRDRYDHFLSNGFPKWRGSGYFYARYRPGLGSVFVFLALVTAGIELVIKRINYTRDRKRLDALIMTAKVLAWGPRFRSIEAGLKADKSDDLNNKGVIVPPEKRVRVPLSGLDVPPLAPKRADEDERAYWDNDEKAVRKAIAANSVNSACCSGDSAPRKQIDAMVTRESEVFIMDPYTNDWVPLDDTAAPKPSMLDTWPARMLGNCAALVTGKRSDNVDVNQDANGATDNMAVAAGSPKKKGNKKKLQ